MASKTCNIPYFSEDDMKGFYSCKNRKVLFHTWNCFWTWSDHSMLREFLVLGNHTDVLKLIDAFDDYLDTLKSQPIATFILPHLSNKMIPSNTNIHTILAIKHKKSFEKCTLQNIFEMRQALLKKCDITPHALQLLTVTDDDSEYTTVFWIIPKCIVPLFNTKVADQWENFNKDIAEISIYPNSLFTMSSTIKVGPLALLTSAPTECDETLSPRDDLCVIEGKEEELRIQKAPSTENERESDGKNEAQDRYEGKIHTEMKEMQLLHKVKMETLNEELSDIKSQVMTKTLQYQKVVEEKRRLVQKIRSLQSATSSSVKMSQMAVQNTKLVADSEVQDLKNHYNLTVEKEKLEMLQGFSKDEKIQHVEKISTQHKRILCKIRDLRTVSYAGKARIFSRKSCMSKECYEQKSVYYAKKISASSLKSSKNKSASNATKRPSRSIARSNTILGCATKSAHTSAAYAYMSTFSAVFCEKISAFSASNVLKRLQGSDNMQQGQQQQDRKSSGDLTTSTESIKSQEPLEYQQRDEEKNMEQFISILHCH
ncbi:uncharacterized protein [Dysidea avara]|uniref:uncharacterized protein isoform X2 n=1 Tax=Dysidea avara TaxID=196820 RepID=UPI0033290234